MGRPLEARGISSNEAHPTRTVQSTTRPVEMWPNNWRAAQTRWLVDSTVDCKWIVSSLCLSRWEILSGNIFQLRKYSIKHYLWRKWEINFYSFYVFHFHYIRALTVDPKLFSVTRHYIRICSGITFQRFISNRSTHSSVRNPFFFLHVVRKSSVNNSLAWDPR